MKRLALIALLVIGLIAAGCSGDDAGEATAEEQLNGEAATERAERAEEQRERAREEALEARIAEKHAERQRVARQQRERAAERRQEAKAKAQAEAEAEERAKARERAERAEAQEQAEAQEVSCPGVDINSASEVELQQIIHIGPDRAGQIVSMRPFSSVDSLTRVSGIAEVRLSEIKEQGLACVS